MKKLILVSVLALFLSVSVNAQSYKLVNGKIETVKKDSTKVKKADAVYQVVNGVTFYKGAKGGIYYFAVSKNTGKTYKRYVK